MHSPTRFAGKPTGRQRPLDGSWRIKKKVTSVAGRIATVVLEVFVEEFAPAMLWPRGQLVAKVCRAPPKWVVSVQKRVKQTVQVSALSDVDRCAVRVGELVNPLLFGNRGHLYKSEAMPRCCYAH